MKLTVHSIKIALVVIVLGFHHGHGEMMRAFKLPGRRDSYVKWVEEHETYDFGAVTFCFRFLMEIVPLDWLVIASVTLDSNGNQNEYFLLDLQEVKTFENGTLRTSLKIASTFKGRKYFESDSFPRLPYKWYHVCSPLQITGPSKGRRQIYVDTKLILDIELEHLETTKWRPQSSFVVGFREFTSSSNPLTGLVTDIHVFGRVLTPEEIADLASCKQIVGDLASWDNSEWQGTGLAVETEVDAEEFCPSKHSEKDIRMLFPAHLTWSNARDMCRRFGGRLHIDSTDNSVVRTAALVHKGENYRISRCKRVWLGASDTEEEGVWKDAETNLPLDIARFWARGQPNGVRIQNCAGIWEQDGVGSSRYDDGGCDIETQCFMCSFKTPPRAMLRGLCPKSPFDQFYTLLWDEEENVPYYSGFSHGTILKYDEDNMAWNLIGANITGTSPSLIHSMGTGAQSWTFSNSICEELTQEEEEQTYRLTLTVCSIEEFTCSDTGNCIPMETRCDQFPNCNDFSDEAGCKLIRTDENYIVDYAPFTILDEESGLVNKVKVSLDVSLLAILQIDEVGKMFGIQFGLKLTWYDFRLQFLNLKKKNNMNVLTKAEKSSVWVPKIVFTNTQEKDTTLNDDEASCYVERVANYSYSQIDEFINSHIFEGESNPLHMERDYYASWICDYDMSWYPFDTQICEMVFGMGSQDGEFLELIPGLLEYLGPEELVQYFIRDKAINQTSEGYVRVEVVLGRRLLGTILTVYIPTLLLVVISYFTNYFKPFFFEAVVTVNLTVLLVMATMFVSVSNDLPKTSYIKMIDIWMIFNLVIPFFLVLLHTFIDAHRLDDDRKVNHHGRTVDVGNKSKQAVNDESDEESQNNDKRPSSVLNIISKMEANNGSWVSEDSSDIEKEDRGRRGFDINLISRRENVQVAALIKYYSNLPPETKAMHIGIMVGKVGLPIVSILFVSIYWWVGISKYISG